MTLNLDAVTKSARTHARRAVVATELRDERIRELRNEGWSFRRIADVVGLSHTQIKNICEREQATTPAGPVHVIRI